MSPLRRHGPKQPRFARIMSAALVAVLVALLPMTSWADGAGSIDQVDTDREALRVLYSVPGLEEGVELDLSSLEVTINDQSVEAAAERVSEDATPEVQRTAIIAFDASNSMRGERFNEAKVAAKAYLDVVPDDVSVGLVAFADEAEKLQQPTTDRAALESVIDGLALSKQTSLYDGVLEALDAAGDEGQRSVLVLSDGKDTSTTSLNDVTKAIRTSGVSVDVVALEQSSQSKQPLEEMAAAGKGSVLEADDPAALVELFSSKATDLANQVLVDVSVPGDLAGEEGSVAVSISAEGETYSDSAFVTLQQAAPARAPRPAQASPTAPTPPRFAISRDMMLGGLAAIGFAALLMVAFALGVFKRERKETLEDRVAAYSTTGDKRGALTSTGGGGTPAGPTKSFTDSAVGMAEKALAGSKSFEAALGGRLDAAGMSLKPAEWLLLHAGVAVGAAVVAFLFTGGSPFVTVIALAGGVVVPWVYLGTKKARRLKAFESHLPDTLQLMSGSLSAGLSLAQSVDTVVREGTQPIAGEFRRAIIEARLGVQIEDALDSIATRMDSEDFEWIVMAIRIQREVGGNLANLLLKVAGTMREREYLRRQVKSLSAEGKLSAYIIGALPVGFVIYLSLVNPGYLEPLIKETLGWMMIGAMCVLMAVGSFWMSRVVKVKV